METKNMIGTIVTLAVVVICVATIMMPVLNEATTTEETLTNTGFFRMSDVTDEESWVLEWSYSTPRVISVNGEDVTIEPEAGGIGLTLLGGTDVMVRYTLNSNNVRVYIHTLYGSNNYYTADSNASQSLTVTYNGSTVVCDNGSGTTCSVDVTDKIYAIDPEGDYILKKSTDTAYVKEDSTILGLGVTYLGSYEQRFEIEGTVGDGFTADYDPYTTMTMTDIEVTATENSDYVDTYDFTQVSFTATYSDTDYDVTYSQVFVPYQITAELSEHLDSGTIALLNAIPVIVIVSLVIAAVGMAVIRNRD